MKRIILTSVFALAFFIFEVSPNTKSSVTDQLRSEISYPEYARKNMEEGYVDVSFYLDSNGKIIIKEIKTDNQVLKRYIVDRFSSISFDPTVVDNTEYSIKIEFRLLR